MQHRRSKLCSKKSVYSLLACCCFFRLPDADDVETATYKYLKKEEFHSNYEYYLVNNKDVTYQEWYIEGFYSGIEEDIDLLLTVKISKS